MKKYLFVTFFVCISIMANGQYVDSLRFKALEVFLPNNIDVGDIEELLAAQNPDGSWALELDPTDDLDSIDYQDNSNSGWEPIGHLERLVEMAEGYALYDDNAGSFTTAGITKDSLIGNITAGLSFWYDTLSQDASCDASDACPCADYCPCSENWWWQRIGRQRELQRIGVLLYDTLNANYNDLLVHIIEDLPNTTAKCNDATEYYTGENKIEVASSMIVRGLLTTDSLLVRAGVDSMATVLEPTTAEGVQYDYSFHQHDEVIYNGGYGITLIERISEWGNILSDTPFDFDTDGKESFFNFILEGCRWMVIGNTKDYSVNGRNIARQWPTSNAAVDEAIMDLLITMSNGTPFSEEIMEMKNKAENELPQNIFGNKHFWKSDYVAHHDTSYFSSIKMCSDRTIGTESVNNENKLGYWLPYGCTYLYQSGAEYRNIFSYWDWTKIPGVTSPNYVPEFDHPEGKTLQSTQTATFVGSTNNPETASDNLGKYSVTTMIYNKDYDNNPDSNYVWEAGDDYELEPANITLVNISARKSWFHFGDEIIALGAGIGSTDANNTIFTTINQSHLNGEVKRDDVTQVAMQLIPPGYITMISPIFFLEEKMSI